MMWQKAWWECRFKTCLCSVVIVIYLIAALFPLIESKGPAVAWDWYLKFVAVFASIVAVMFAGTGINSQTTWGMARGFHSSMYFLLSLPVSRRYALFVRSVTGMLLTLIYIVLSVGLFSVFGRFRAAPLTFQHALSSIVFISIGAFAVFGIATFLMTLFDEAVAGWLSCGGVCGMFGAWAGLDSGKGVDPMAFLDGQQFIQSGHVEWAAVIFSLVVGLVFLMAALRVVERREY